jgi:hypothetical protein
MRLVNIFKLIINFVTSLITFPSCWTLPYSYFNRA